MVGYDPLPRATFSEMPARFSVPKQRQWLEEKRTEGKLLLTPARDKLVSCITLACLPFPCCYILLTLSGEAPLPRGLRRTAIRDGRRLPPHARHGVLACGPVRRRGDRRDGADGRGVPHKGRIVERDGHLSQHARCAPAY